MRSSGGHLKRGFTLEKSGLGIFRTGLQLANFEHMKFIYSMFGSSEGCQVFLGNSEAEVWRASASWWVVQKKLTGVVSSILIVPINPIYYDLLLLVEGDKGGGTHQTENEWLAGGCLSHPFPSFLRWRKHILQLAPFFRSHPCMLGNSYCRAIPIETLWLSSSIPSPQLGFQCQSSLGLSFPWMAPAEKSKNLCILGSHLFDFWVKSCYI
jgi:hypothetical protein